MSRLARSCKDWHHLLEVCAIFGALLADQDGVYDPSDPNDRLLLGLKGQISELELHTIRSRLDRGKLNKARRGELFINAPIGYVKTPAGGLALDPDEQVRAVVRLIFDKFDELGTAHAVARYLSGTHIRLGVRPHRRAESGNLEWRPARMSTVYRILHPSGLRRHLCLRADPDRTEATPPERSAGHPARPDGENGRLSCTIACPPTSPGSSTFATPSASARTARPPRPEGRARRASPCSAGWCSAAGAGGGRSCSTQYATAALRVRAHLQPGEPRPAPGSAPRPWTRPSASRCYRR